MCGAVCFTFCECFKSGLLYINTPSLLAVSQGTAAGSGLGSLTLVPSGSGESLRYVLHVFICSSAELDVDVLFNAVVMETFLMYAPFCYF